MARKYKQMCTILNIKQNKTLHIILNGNLQFRIIAYG